MPEIEIDSPEKGRLRKIIITLVTVACFIAPFFVVWIISGLGSALLMCGACLGTMIIIGLIAYFVIDDTNKE
jgi:hypothetical protein